MEDLGADQVGLARDLNIPVCVYFSWFVLDIRSFDYIDWRIGGGIWTGFATINLKLLADRSLIIVPAMVWFLSACTADLLITGTLVIALVRYRLW